MEETKNRVSHTLCIVGSEIIKDESIHGKH